MSSESPALAAITATVVVAVLLAPVTAVSACASIGGDGDSGCTDTAYNIFGVRLPGGLAEGGGLVIALVVGALVWFVVARKERSSE